MLTYLIFIASISYCHSSERALESCQSSEYLNDNGKCYPCGLNCEECESSTKCSKCYLFNFLDKESRQCFSCPFTCLECDSYQYCTSCVIGEPLNGVCQACGDNCLECTLDGCKECIIGYYLKDQECLSCSAGCNLCDNENKCIQCDTLFKLVDGKCVYFGNCQNFDGVECLECYSDSYLDNGKCHFCNSNCISCKSKDECTECYEGYLNNGKCISCPDNCYNCDNEGCLGCVFNYYAEDKVCKACKEECGSCLNADVCESCAYGYFEKDGKCEKCTVSNCMSCGNSEDSENSETCIFCEYSYALMDGKCTKCPENCLACSEETVCDNCEYGWLKTGEGKCIIDAGCQIYENDKCYLCGWNYYLQNGICHEASYPCIPQYYSSDCAYCYPGNYLTNDFTCSQCPTGCNYCINGEECIQCYSGFYKDDSGFCKPCPENCDVCTDKNKCDKCSFLYYLEDSKCICSYPDSCDMHAMKCFDTMADEQNCNEGYYLSGSGCKPCLQGCKSCSSVTRCTDCFDNFTESSGFCYPYGDSSSWGDILQVSLISLLGLIIS